MVKSLSIVEVGPRDGLQSEPEVLPTETKIEFIRRLVAAGLRRIEVASFVSPKRVPLMADADELVPALPRDDAVTYIGLVMNRRGFERAREAGVDEIGFVIVASETFNRRNQGVAIRDSVAVWHDIAAAAREAGMAANVTISAAFGCPYEGEVPATRVIEIATQVARDEPVEIGLADTIGVAVPPQVEQMLASMRQAVGEMPLRCHFHNTRNTGMANAYAALANGVASLDAGAGGMGGCPFAPAAASSVGNIPTEDLQYMLYRSGVDTGVALERVVETTRWMEQQLGHELPGMLAKAGDFPKADAHTAA